MLLPKKLIRVYMAHSLTSCHPLRASHQNKMTVTFGGKVASIQYQNDVKLIDTKLKLVSSVYLI